MDLVQNIIRFIYNLFNSSKQLSVRQNESMSNEDKIEKTSASQEISSVKSTQIINNDNICGKKQTQLPTDETLDFCSTNENIQNLSFVDSSGVCQLKKSENQLVQHQMDNFMKLFRKLSVRSQLNRKDQKSKCNQSKKSKEKLGKPKTSRSVFYDAIDTKDLSQFSTIENSGVHESDFYDSFECLDVSDIKNSHKQILEDNSLGVNLEHPTQKSNEFNFLANQLSLQQTALPNFTYILNQLTLTTNLSLENDPKYEIQTDICTIKNIQTNALVYNNKINFGKNVNFDLKTENYVITSNSDEISSSSVKLQPIRLMDVISYLVKSLEMPLTCFSSDLSFLEGSLKDLVSFYNVFDGLSTPRNTRETQKITGNIESVLNKSITEAVHNNVRYEIHSLEQTFKDLILLTETAEIQKVEHVQEINDLNHINVLDSNISVTHTSNKLKTLSLYTVPKQGSSKINSKIFWEEICSKLFTKVENNKKLQKFFLNQTVFNQLFLMINDLQNNKLFLLFVISKKLMPIMKIEFNDLNSTFTSYLPDVLDDLNGRITLNSVKYIIIKCQSNSYKVKKVIQEISNGKSYSKQYLTSKHGRRNILNLNNIIIVSPTVEKVKNIFIITERNNIKSANIINKNCSEKPIIPNKNIETGFLKTQMPKTPCTRVTDFSDGTIILNSNVSNKNKAIVLKYIHEIKQEIVKPDYDTSNEISILSKVTTPNELNIFNENFLEFLINIPTQTIHEKLLAYGKKVIEQFKKIASKKESLQLFNNLEHIVYTICVQQYGRKGIEEILDDRFSTKSKKLANLEDTLKNLMEENEKLLNEKITVHKHLENCCDALDDVKEKYDSSKEVVFQYQYHENQILNLVENQFVEISVQDTKYQALKVQVMEKLEKCNKEYNQTKNSCETKILTLKTKLRCLQIQTQSLNQDLNQKMDECNQLNKICDNLLKNKKTIIT